MKPVHTQQGVILIMALLYLLAVTVLVISTFSSSILQWNMAVHFTDEVRAFQQAEAALLAAEKAIQGNELEGRGSINQGFYHYKRRAENDCGLVYYHIDVTGAFAMAKRTLQAILLVPVPTNKECPDGMPDRKRVWWNSK